MKLRIKRTLAGLSMAAAAMAIPATASAIAFDIEWIGSSGYRMLGTFSYSDSLINTGPITEASLDSVSMTVYFSGFPQGTWDYVADGIAAPYIFNFNFDTTTETLLVGGTSTGDQGQDWNVTPGGVSCPATSVGFSSGNFGQGVCVQGSFVDRSLILIGQSTLIATRSVPEPTSLALLGVGLAGIAFGARRRA
jgi:hypothetical protein